MSYKSKLDVGLPNKEEAEFAMKSLQVDQDLNVGQVKRSFSIIPSEGANDGEVILRVEFEATDGKKLRVAVASFQNQLEAVLRKFQELDEKAAKQAHANKSTK